MTEDPTPAGQSEPHLLGHESVHTFWDRDLPPQLYISPGDRVIFSTLDASFGGAARRVENGDEPDLDADLTQVISESAYAERPAPGLRGHPLTGPVAIEGAEPGDVLEIEVLDIQTAPWGWTACRPNGIGLLDAELSAGGVLTEQTWHYWDLRGKTHAPFHGARVPLAPFCGVMGLAPAGPGPHPTAPPRRVGGNMDVRQLVAGSTLYLPVEVPGALFSVGDVHAAQGDGELCGTGVETEASVTLRFKQRRGDSIGGPQLRAPATPPVGEQFATTGHHPDLMEAARTAAREMLRYLHREHGLSMLDAYLLSSACVDLKISQIVDAPNWTVSAFVPLGIFGT